MKIQTALASMAAASAIVIATQAQATITITRQSRPAPTYTNLITFDEPGTPSGGLVPSNYWAGQGITITDGVNGPNTVVDDFSSTFPWINSGNAVQGTFGNFLTFDQDVSSMSFQAWDPSGPPDFFGDGLYIVLYDINNNDVGDAAFTGAWGGIGDTWINITATGGDSFRSAVIFNNSFDPTTFIDNVSWTNVPTPGALALFGAAGLVGSRRRRRAMN